MSNWEMLSDIGNQKVDDIVQRAEQEKLSWPEVWKELYLLHRNPGFILAMDPEVCRKVYKYFGFTSPYYFYGLNVNGTTLFDVFPDLKA